jgi:hypothetical protein
MSGRGLRHHNDVQSANAPHPFPTVALVNLAARTRPTGAAKQSSHCLLAQVAV